MKWQYQRSGCWRRRQQWQRLLFSVGGLRNGANNTGAVATGGVNNSASGVYSSVVGGLRNKPRNTNAVAVGGNGSVSGENLLFSAAQIMGPTILPRLLLAASINSSGVYSSVVGGLMKPTIP
jgi:hypothetical protein